MRYSLMVLSALLTTACTQPAVMVEHKGNSFFGKNNAGFAASQTAPYHAASASGSAVQGQAYTSPAASPAINYSESTAKVASINTVASQDLAPIGAEKPAAKYTVASTEPSSGKTLWQAIAPGAGSAEFIMPATSKITSNYAAGKGKKGDSIHFASAHGEPVYAAADGVAAFASDELKSYGNMIIIKHDNNMNTSYAHLSRMVVAKGSEVKQGQIIGYMGQPEMQFTMRKGTSPVDPNQYISKQVAAN